MSAEIPESMGVCALIPPGQKGFRPMVYGMGILVGDDPRRHVVTCAHVIDTAFRHSGNHNSLVVEVCFPYTQDCTVIPGKVVSTTYLPFSKRGNGPAEDRALIELDAPAPAESVGARFKDHVPGNTVKLFGFGSTELSDGSWYNHDRGEFAVTKIAGTVPGGAFQLDSLADSAVTARPGFSGAGIYDPVQDAIVGMFIESPKDDAKRTGIAISIQSLQSILPKAQQPSVTGKTGKAQEYRVAPRAWVDRAKETMAEIETYLSKVGDVLPSGDPDAGLTPVLLQMLGGQDDASKTLRSAFGLPTDVKVLEAMSTLLESKEQSVLPLTGFIAQRLVHLLWRYVSTVVFIDAKWARQAQNRAKQLSQICEPYILARKPRLEEVVAAIDRDDDLRAYAESAPDATLYAIMRAIEKDENGRVRKPQSHNAKVHARALDLMHTYVGEMLGDRKPDDSSNAWWALRLGIDADKDRFLKLLPRIADEYDDIRVPPEQKVRLSAVPEIYKPLRTASYTLSNIQAIFEFHLDLDNAIVVQLHEIVHMMVDRLLNASHNRNLYLVSTHHEGLRNYLDYVKDQKLPITG